MLIRIGSIVFVIPVILLLVVYSLDMSAISDCLAQDMTYDPDADTCVAGSEYPPTFYTRHPMLVNLSLVASIIGTLVMTWGMILKGPSR
ncbi:MAG: hypothetical protein CMI09_01160 [Oceanospirillaceae bacterium]|nr:hypothetical protein [Oceanospirillaceae bacterium]